MVPSIPPPPTHMSIPKLPKPSCWSHIWWRCLWNVEWNIMEKCCCPVTSKVTWTISGRSRGVRVWFIIFSHLFHAYLSHPGLQIGLGHDREACAFHCLKPITSKTLRILENIQKLSYSLSWCHGAFRTIFLALHGCQLGPSQLHIRAQGKHARSQSFRRCAVPPFRALWPWVSRSQHISNIGDGVCLCPMNIQKKHFLNSIWSF
jgi:hypothetical protein